MKSKTFYHFARILAHIRLGAFLLAAAAAGLAVSACAGDGGGDGGGDDDTEQDTDSTTDSQSATDDDTDSDTFTDAVRCPPLPPPTGNIIDVTPDDAQSLPGIIASSSPGDTILFADGDYQLNGAYIWIDVPGITLRSASGNRDAVVLDGNYQGAEIISIAVSDVTIADLTLRRAYYHGIHVMSSATGDTLNTVIYNVVVIDTRSQAIKINPAAGGYYPDNGLIACSRLELTDAGRPHVNPIITGCYTGGVDAHQSWGWVIRDNWVEGFWCPTGLAEHGIHLWRGCRDTVVERNVLKDNMRGIGFGLANGGEARTFSDDPCPGTSGYVGHYRGIIRNNFVFVSDPDLYASEYGDDCGICLSSSCNTQVLHNSLANTSGGAAAIEWRFATCSAEVTNNLANTHFWERDGASATLAGNIESGSLDLFVDGAGGDLHLSPSAGAAIDQGVSLSPGLCDEDIDGDLRDGNPDIGADEL